MALRRSAGIFRSTAAAYVSAAIAAIATRLNSTTVTARPGVIRDVSSET